VDDHFEAFFKEDKMGISGWNELQDNVSLVGAVTGDNYSGHDAVFQPFADWDWSLFVQPGTGL